MRRLFHSFFHKKHTIKALALFSVASVFGLPFVLEPSPKVQGARSLAPTVNAPVLRQEFTSLETKSAFETKTEDVVTALPFETRYEDTDELYIGETQIKTPGVEGKRTETFKTYYWNGELVDRVLLNTVNEPPKEQVVLRGTKKNIRTLSTELGELKYYRKLTSWATSYDGNCKGCTGRTFTGTTVHHGVCAVDPNVIPLGSYIYVPGYGVCHAEDIGGAIKGNDIDLGFEDVASGWWSARYTDAYLLER